MVRRLGIAAKRAAPPGGALYGVVRRLSWLLPRTIRGNYEANPVAERLHRFCAARRRVFFVQVGAHEGGVGDQISLYVKRDGWHGILVEPVPRSFARLQAGYAAAPGLIFENVAIAEADGRRRFHHLSGAASAVYPLADQLGSLDRDVVLSHAEQIPGIEDYLLDIEVPCLTFDTLLRRHDVQSVDVLNIDAEGYDGKLLRSFPWDRYRPQIVLYEHQHLEASEGRATQRMLATLGYDLVRSRTNTIGELRPGRRRPVAGSSSHPSVPSVWVDSVAPVRWIRCRP